MNEAAAEARRAYKRAWAKANPDKIRAQQERYWTKKAEALKEAEKFKIPDDMPEPPEYAEPRRFVTYKSNGK